MQEDRSRMEPKSPVQHVAFIYHRFDMGGIETLILRAADTYINEGLQVTLFTRPGAMLSELNGQVAVVLFDRYRELYRYCRRLDARTAIVAFDPVSFMVMRRLQFCSWVTTGQKSMGHAGVFHPRAWAWPGDSVFFRWICKRVFVLTPDQYLFYMSKAVMDETSVRLDLQREIDSEIIRLPIGGQNSAPWAPSEDRNLRIVSVGRLVPAKSYNRTIPNMVQRLSAMGVAVQWDIWGDGEDFGAIQKEIECLGVEKQVRLMGALEYSKFNETVNEYDLFVGIGTAILEAAMLGMPSICAIDFDDTKSYGFLDSAPTDAIGEEVSSVIYTTVEKCVLEYSTMKREQRLELGARCRAAAVAKSNGGESYARIIDAPVWPGLSWRELMVFVLSIPYLVYLDSRILRRGAKAFVSIFREKKVQVFGRKLKRDGEK